MKNEEKNFRKGFYILLSILVASAFWIYVDEFGHNGEPRMIKQEVNNVEIEYLNEETLTNRGLMLLDDGTSTEVDLTFVGKRLQVTKLSQSKVSVTADLSSVTNPGIQTVPLNVNYPNQDSVSVEKKSISRATVNISELSSKTVEVRCELVGNVAEGYSAGQVQLSQDEVEVRGLAKDVAKVSYAKVTLHIGKDVETTVSQVLSCYLYGDDDTLLRSGSFLLSEDSIQATLPVYVTKELSLMVGFKESPGVRSDNLKYVISPSTIAVSGETTKLRGVNTIYLGEFDLMDLVGTDSASHSYPIIIPDGCQNLSGVTRATMEVQFKDMEIATVDASLFQYLNPPADKDVEVLRESLAVKIFGTSEDVAAITPENITVMLNLSDHNSAFGTYSVPAAIEVQTDGDIGVLGSYEVQVKISEKVPDEVLPEE